MIISLYTELPGIFIGNTNFALLNPLLAVRRLFSILFFFRLTRFYQTFISLDAVIDLMVRTPGTFLTLFTIILLLTCGSIFKILEQNEQPLFENFFSTLWYSFVTISTLGYGDMTPLYFYIIIRSWSARIIAVVAMIIGIGLIGTISGNISKSILNVNLNIF